MKNSLPVILVLLCVVSAILGARKEPQFMVSSYSAEGEPDVRLFDMSRRNGPRVASDATVWNNPSYFTMADKRTFYFINEVPFFAGCKGGGITLVRKVGAKLEPQTGAFISRGGSGPCFVTMSDDKKYLLTANYGHGSVSVIKLDEKGMPGVITDTILFTKNDSLISHPHMILYNRTKMLYYVTDLGLDKIYIFRLDAVTGKLIAAETPFIKTEKGSGPRHMVTDKHDRMLYVVNEKNSTVSVYEITTGIPVLKQSLNAVSKDFSGKNFSGDICMSPSERFLYVTNRGSNTIDVFKVEKDKTLELSGSVSCGGNWPRNMALSKNGKRMIVCNQKSGDLSFFRINRRTGMPVKENYSYKLSTPSCVKFIE